MKKKRVPKSKIIHPPRGREMVASRLAALTSVAASSILGLGLQKKKNKWGFKGNGSKTEKQEKEKIKMKEK